MSLASIFRDRSTHVTCLDWSMDCTWMAFGSVGSGIHVLNIAEWKLLAPSIDGLSLGSSNEKASEVDDILERTTSQIA